MERKELILTLITSGVFLLAVSGFTVHVAIISMDYFEYKTVNKINVSTEDELPIPSLSLCFRYVDLLDRVKGQEYGIGKTIHKTTSEFNDDMGKLTVKQIFDLTPAAEDSIFDCDIREYRTMKMIERMSKEECGKKFSTNKYLMQEYICYDFERVDLRKYPFFKTTHALTYVGVVYILTLSPRFDSVDLFLPIAYIYTEEEATNNFPMYSRSFSKPSHKSKNTASGTPLANMFDIYHSWTRIYLMPSPYETHCTNETSKEECTKECLIHELESENRLPYTEIIDSPLDIKPVSPRDMEDNATFLEFLLEAEKKCSGKCIHDICNHFYTLTGIKNWNAIENNWTARYRVMTAERPNLVMRIVPQTSLSEFIIYICSLFGIYFGMNVFALNPRSAVEKFLVYREKKKARNRLVRPRRPTPFISVRACGGCPACLPPATITQRMMHGYVDHHHHPHQGNGLNNQWNHSDRD